MEVAGIDWSNLKANFSYTESDSLAVIRTAENAIAWMPVFLNQATGEPCINRDGQWRAAETISGFERFEKARFKRLYDTAKGELV